MKCAQAAEIDMIDGSGIPPKSGFEFMARKGGGRESVEFSHIDYKNHLRTKITIEMVSGDTGGVLEYLQQKQLEDPNFFYAIQVDEADLITNIFWADAKMMADYEVFGDVICFDTTYRKHKDGRPIALFVGVNHHKQTIIFGAALLYDETTSTFMWLFDTFYKAMGRKLPQTILTDQDAAMAKALASQWPQTYHRLRVWHIFQNAAIHLNHVFSQFKDFSRDFSSCVYDYEHEDDFLNAWNEMLSHYNLQNNDWLRRMFSIKEKWALVYGRDTFCADMTTTQRSESMNKVIKHYAELSRSYDCAIVDHIETGMVATYTVTPYKKRYRYNVTYNLIEDSIACTCRKFEFGGLLCSHALRIFCARGITRIPNKYILKRWKRVVKNGTFMSKNGNAPKLDSREIVGRRYQDLCRLATRLSTRAAENEDEYVEVKEALNKLFDRVGLKKVNVEQKSGHSSYCASEKVDNVVVDSTGGPKVVKGIKAKPKSGNTSKRPKGALEGARKTRAKKKITSEADQVLFLPEVDEVTTTQPNSPNMPSTNLLHPLQLPSYQAMLGMDYSIAESFTQHLMQPIHQVEKAQTEAQIEHREDDELDLRLQLTNSSATYNLSGFSQN